MNVSIKRELIIYGAGGLAKVVLDAALKENRYEILGVLDDNAAIHGTQFCGFPVLGGSEYLTRGELANDVQVVLGIGANKVRQKLQAEIGALGFSFARVIHPMAVLGRGVVVQEGVVIMAGVVINADTVVQDHAIVNTGATIDHDGMIKSYAHISPGAHLAGNVSVGERTYLGTGVSVIPGVSIGDDVVVGAGAAVVSDLDNNVTAIGVPASVIETHE